MGTEVSTTPKQPYDPKAPRKQVLTPPGKPEVKEKMEGVTPRGANIKIDFDKRFGMFKIVFSDGGTVPKELTGMWTEEARAKTAVKLYLDNYWKNRS